MLKYYSSYIYQQINHCSYVVLGTIPVNIVIHNVNHQYQYDSIWFEIMDIIWLITEIFLWLGGYQEAITDVNTEDNTWHFQLTCIARRFRFILISVHNCLWRTINVRFK